jgi:Leucine-rich repeat (LRR) protein
LPGIFHRLQELVDLDISRNLFTEFPEVVCKCVALQTVRAGYNPIKSVTKDLLQLRSLSFLALEQTEISTPPEVFAHMHWTDVSGVVLPASERSSYRFKITPEDEAELEGLIKSKGKGRQKREARLRSVIVF